MNTTPRPLADERSWQMVHDQVFKAMYGLEPVEARYIRECLHHGRTDKNRNDPNRTAAREKLMSHAKFIDKYFNVAEFICFNFNTAHGQNSWSHTDHSWRDNWHTLRGEVTAQIFGRPADNRRPLFHDYVRLFARTCQLYNWGAQTETEWNEEMQQLDQTRWDVFRFAFMLWVHRDIHTGNLATSYVIDPATKNFVRKLPKDVKTIYLWNEFNWIIQHDKWVHGFRNDPKPPGPKLGGFHKRAVMLICSFILAR
ncbi:uncharacterized protein QC763_001240 [Podospora pseudopauciseta]|uniref:Uncharacterized protein n=1 Tax=Podospora pseudopauciseta TaxID=2093780 RepID=A0ABR0HK66_9PEZI|nr:hypothetical protein QC763_001240 [Podospora pseudopauciseta]